LPLYSGIPKPKDADIAQKFIYPHQADLPKLFINYNIKAGHSILAHSRPDKIGTPRLLPLYIRNILKGLSAKKSAQILYPAVTQILFFFDTIIRNDF
jgi:hypothetical protein